LIATSDVPKKSISEIVSADAPLSISSGSGSSAEVEPPIRDREGQGEVEMAEQRHTVWASAGRDEHTSGEAEAPIADNSDNSDNISAEPLFTGDETQKEQENQMVHSAGSPVSMAMQSIAETPPVPSGMTTDQQVSSMFRSSPPTNALATQQQSQETLVQTATMVRQTGPSNVKFQFGMEITGNQQS
jgi:hypothetical protein